MSHGRAIAALVLLLTAASRAPGADAWMPIGPDGGWVFQVATDPSEANVAFAATTAGLFKTTDGAASWVRLPVEHIARVAIAPSASATIYAATSYVSVGGAIVSKSVDGGASWTAVYVSGGDGYTVVRTLAVDPTDPDVVYAGTDGNGLLKTVDGGATWNPSATGITDVGPFTPPPQVAGIAIDPSSPSTVYAATCCGTGLFKSTNGGGSWTPSDTGLTANGAAAVAIDLATPSTLYALAPNVHKSVDSGATWTPSDTALPAAPWSIAVGPGVLHAALSGGDLYRSDDGGGGWSPMGCDNLLYPTVAVRAGGGILVSSAHLGNMTPGFVRGGVYASDGTGTCTLSSAGITAHFVTAFAADPLDPGTLYMAVERTGAFKSIDAGATWADASQGLTGIDLQIDAIVVDPVTPSTLHLLSGNGLNQRVWRSLDAAGSWQTVYGPYPFIAALAADPVVTGHVFAGSTHFAFGQFVLPAAVTRSTDGGTTWTNAASMPDESVATLAVAPSDPLVVYAGTVMGVLRSLDGGVTFDAGDVNGLPFAEAVMSLAVDPNDAATVYAAIPTAGGVFKSTDGGVDWVPANAGLPAGIGLVAVDPFAPAIVYAAGNPGGVFRSLDRGSTWTAANDGIGATDVSTLSTDATIPGRVYAGTIGGSAFVRDFPSPCADQPDGTPCDDGNPCTLGDACSAGACVGASPTCGDGAVAGCEECDAGARNGAGSCCSATCTLEAAGTACADDGSLCTADACDAGGTCVHAPEPDPTCVGPGARGGALKIVNAMSLGDRVRFKLAKGTAIPPGDFGDPNGATVYELCVYDDGGDVVAYRGRPLAPCATTPCWKSIRNGWRFESPGGADGVTNVTLKGSLAPRRASIVVRAKGSLALRALPLTKSPSVVAQVRTSGGACWGATFSTSTRNDTRRFTARSD